MSKVSIAIVGATGAVGRKFINLLDSTSLDINKIRLFASEKSVGSKIDVLG